MKLPNYETTQLSNYSTTELIHRLRHCAHVVERQLWVERKREYLARQPFGDRETAGAIAEVGVRRLEMNRVRILNRRADPARLQVCGEFVAALRLHHVEVIDGLAVRLVAGRR